MLVVPANLYGVRVFGRISDGTFKRLVLLLLMGMGVALIDRGFHVWGELFTYWHATHPSFGAREPAGKSAQLDSSFLAVPSKVGRAQ